MKLSKEYTLLFIIGLYLLGYVLDLIVDPLKLVLPNPYYFFQPNLLSSYPFTAASVLIKTIAIFATPLWLMSFSSDKGYIKPGFLLILSSLIQLYAIQAIATKSKLIPVEWSLSLASAGMLLLIPTLFMLIRAVIVSTHQNLSNEKMKQAFREAKKETSDEPDIVGKIFNTED